MAEILQNTGAKLWSIVEDRSVLQTDVFDLIVGTGGKSDIRLIDEAIGKINENLNGYYFKIINDKLYICKDSESGTTSLPLSITDDDGHVALKVDGTSITIDGNGVVHGATIDDAFSLTSENAVQNKVVKAKFDEVDQKINTNETTISSHTTAIATLNGEGEGSVKKTVTDEIAKVVADAPESLDTLKEISDWISSHESDASTMNSDIQTNKSDIATLQTDKVDKETGKGLSTNDYTTDEKTKLAGIDTGANKTIVDSVLDTSSENPVQNKVIAGEINTLKKSVSDGKTLVATAITDKGVETAADATFDIMAENIEAIETGGGVGLNVFTQETEPETKDGIWIQTKNQFNSVKISDKIYNLKLAMGSWSLVSPAPYENCVNNGRGAAVVYNNEIHVLGGSSSPANTNHYKWDGSSWSSVSTLPFSLGYGAAVVYHDEIHILGGNGNEVSTKHYKWDGSSWSSVSTLPFPLGHGAAVVYNNEIHILVSTKHYKWDGSSWSSVSTLPVPFQYRGIVVYNDKIHILGGGATSSTYTTHYKWNGDSWSRVSTLPYKFNTGAAVVYHNEIHIFGGNGNEVSTKHYKWDGSSWSSVSTLKYGMYYGCGVVYEDSIYEIGYTCGINSIKYQEVVDSSTKGSTVSIYQNSSSTTGTYSTTFISGASITGENNKFPSGFDDVFYIDESNNIEVSSTYYGDGTQWIKFKN